MQLELTGTPEKFRPLAEEAAQDLAALLRELAALEDKSSAQYIRLCRKGRIIEFRDGVREEITDTNVLKETCKARFVLKREADGWRIDEAYSAASGADRWKRDWYF